MNTLITPAQAVASAFTDGEYLAPEAIGEGDIAAAEQRYIVPVIGIVTKVGRSYPSTKRCSQASMPASRPNTSQPR